MRESDRLREQLKQAEAREYQERKEAEQAQYLAFQEIIQDQRNFEWLSTPKTYHSLSEQFEGVQVQRRLKPEILEAWKGNGPASFSSTLAEGIWVGMFYYRTDENILTRAGGGYRVLKDPKLCSDEEWERICSGDIPEKFKR